LIYRKSSRSISINYFGGKLRGRNGMIDTILAYLISFSIIGTGVGWIVAGMSSAALWIGIGVAAVVVGTLSVVNELHNRTR
jgi:hypothetical protein